MTKKSEKKTKKKETVELTKEEHEALLKEVEEAKEKKEEMLRAVADFENSKKRLQKQRDEFVQFANKKIMTDLLDVIDNLERAMMSVHDKEASKSLLEGVELVNKQIIETLKSHGLERLEALGEAFDPNLHEAIGSVESDEHEEDHVAEVVQPGYKLKDQLLRPAMVRVSKGK